MPKVLKSLCLIQFWSWENFPFPNMDETEGFQCLGHSNWTICSPLSHFWFQIFTTLSLSYWEANSYSPRGLIMDNGDHPTQELNESGNFECLGHSNWTICSPLSPFCSESFPNFFTFMLGSPFLLPQRANYGRGEFFQLPIWIRQSCFSPWGIQTGPFAAL